MKISLVLNGLFAAAVAAPAGPSNIVHEKRHVSPRWIKREAADAQARIPVRIALKQRNLSRGMDYLVEVSDPSSTKYGKHLTKDEVVGLFAPDESSINAVKSWLVRSGVSASKITIPRSKGWIDFRATVGELESMLKTKYHMYDHVQSRNAHIGTDEYTLPHEVSSLVDFITPGVVMSKTSRPSQNAKRDGRLVRPHVALPEQVAQLLAANPASTSHCSQYITPACIKAQYNITDGTLSDPSNRLGVFETADDEFSQDDLDAFYAKYASNIPKGTGPKIDLIDGATAPADPGDAGGESDLDFEIAIPIIYPQGTELYQAATQNNDIFNTFLDAVDGSYCSSNGGDDPTVDGATPDEQCGTFTPANVISFSYGTAEADYPTNYLQRQCNEFLKLGLQGSSIVFASGDDGVARRSGACLGSNRDIFAPGEQASCPYVTTVGSTVLLPSGQEAATETFSSGGGFSNIWTIPDYQNNAVSGYLAKHDPGYKSYTTQNGTIPTTGGIYNRAGRGYPDVAALGDKAVIVVNGKFSTSGGTSMSAPLVAAIFTRINDERIKAGKKPIGFANPALYKNPSMFNDVTQGNQAKGGPDGDSKPSACGNKGFSAVRGWDPVTGLGTPNYPAMLEYFLKI
ncbi:uncharacterized protein UV8b_05927 [Ustilaginoidea virens]|uniref:tripeptidyl-peptidase II n=1 Tax=Ustilaginoidea virens TaxID=1159556 RepID=A0A8E5HUA8_USTVR|nr:uncharacterized protein UV8b_05927 [Ustilaginoidea virens]QUC21684.1 hypothetical protein UV8b_05927 [Ustilaginoidea virens]